MVNEKANIPFNKPTMLGDELDFIADAVKRGQLAGDGYYTDKCNQLILAQTHSESALLTHSCTAALEIAAILCDLKPGDEVIMPSYTFVSTANAVVLRGATPVFVDIARSTVNIDCEEVRKAITAKTKAIFAVHYAGFMADVYTLKKLCNDHGIFLVEDAAQAFGSTLSGKPAGSFGHLAAFSFHETKNVIAGEGGALTINDPTLCERAEIVRQKGTNRKDFLAGLAENYTWVDIGSSFLPGELISAFLYAQLLHQERIKAERLKIFRYYQQRFSVLEQLKQIELIVEPVDCKGNGHMFYFLLPSERARAEFISHMSLNGITCPFHYVPLHSSPAGLKYGRATGDMCVTNDISSRLVRLPMYRALAEEDRLDRVVSSVMEYFSSHR
jgi:dTDP-4-amino-4,6-dideoxygalactose transaminase